MLKMPWALAGVCMAGALSAAAGGYLYAKHEQPRAEATLGDLLRCADFIESLMSEKRTDEAAAKVEECEAAGYIDAAWIQAKGYPRP